MQRNNYVYILYEDDRLKLPIYVADSIKELARLTNTCYVEMLDIFAKQRYYNYKYKIEKVDIREPEEKFTIDEYKKYCNSEKLSVGSFSSLKNFAKHCYGAL